MTAPARLGDRFRLARDSAAYATFVQYAPSHTVGARVVVPAGTVIVAFDQAPGATAVVAYPEDYATLETVLVPAEERSSGRYAGRYALTFAVKDIGELLEPIEPLNPRSKHNRLPRTSGARGKS